MACNICESNFQSYQSMIPSITKPNPTTALLYIQNQGRNTLMIQRILLCYTLTGGGSGILFLRPPGSPISWSYPSAFLEVGLTALFYTFSTPNLQNVEVQAEYIEIDGRSRSCVY